MWTGQIGSGLIIYSFIMLLLSVLKMYPFGIFNFPSEEWKWIIQLWPYRLVVTSIIGHFVSILFGIFVLDLWAVLFLLVWQIETNWWRRNLPRKWFGWEMVTSRSHGWNRTDRTRPNDPLQVNLQKVGERIARLDFSLHRFLCSFMAAFIQRVFDSSPLLLPDCGLNPSRCFSFDWRLMRSWRPPAGGTWQRPFNGCTTRLQPPLTFRELFLFLNYSKWLPFMRCFLWLPLLILMANFPGILAGLFQNVSSRFLQIPQRLFGDSWWSYLHED